MTTSSDQAADLVSPATKVVSQALALSVLLMMIRFHLMGFPWTSYFVPEYLFYMIEASTYDNRTILGALAIAVIASVLLRGRRRGQRFVQRAFTTFAVIALVFGLVNHEAVGMLGAPVNFQWLGYSDFLTSLDAKEALKAAITWQSVLAFAAIIAAMFGIGRLLQIWLRPPNRRFNTYAVLCVACAFYFAFFTWRLWSNKKYYRQANPMVALVESYFQTEKPSIFTMPTDIGTEGLAVVAERKPAPPPPRRVEGVKNVVFFVLESTAAEYVEGFGGRHPVNPVMRRLRGQSMNFTAAYAHAPTTNKSIVSMFCSVYPWVSNHSLTKKYPDNKLVSLAAILRARGYRTGFFNSADLRHQGAGKFLEGLKFEFVQDLRNRDTDLEGFVDPDGYELMNASDDFATTTSLIKWIERDPTKPFFGVVWTMGTHYPYHFRGEEIDYGEEKSRGLNRYYNAMRHADRCLGEVLDTLGRLELTDSTLVVVVGDHGEAFGQHRHNWAHASCIFEENVRVPLVFINSRWFHGETSDRPCGLIDIAPTVLDVLGLPFPEGWQGRSLLREWTRPRIYFFSPWSHMLFGFREGNMKYIYRAREDRSVAYDLSTDPREKNNILPTLPLRTSDDIKRKLAAWVQYQAALMKKRILK